MANTTNLNMVKPAGTDHALISVINSNMDIIDGAVGALPSGTTLQGEIDSANTAIGNLSNKTVTPQTLVSVDLDNIVTTGVYLLGGSITHSPYGNYGYLIVIAQGTDIVQYYTNSNSAGTYIRRKYSGSWNDWEQLALKSDLTPSGYTAPTSIHANATLVQGGYVRVGNMIVVNCRLTINTAIPATTTIAKFPGYTKTGISYSHVALANNKLIDLGIDQGGDLRSPVQVTTGTLVISGVYFALS